MKRTVAVTTLLIGLVTVPVPAMQDEPPSRRGRGMMPGMWGGPQEIPQEEDRVVRVFALQHTSAWSCASSIQEAGLGVRVAADDATNSLIVSGRESAMEPVEQLIAALDVPGAGGGTVETGFFKTPTPVTGSLLSLVHTIVSKRTEVDGHGYLIVAKGPRTELEQVERLLAEYALTCEDREGGSEAERTRPLQLTFFFLQAVEDPDSPDASVQPLPDLLHPVAQALEGVGFAHPGLLATFVVNVESQSEFEVRGLIEQAGSKTSAMIEGEADCATGSSARIRLEVTARLQTIERKGPPLPLFDVSTTLLAPHGDIVILAASPAHTAEGKLIALAVRAAPTGGTVERKK